MNAVVIGEIISDGRHPTDVQRALRHSGLRITLAVHAPAG
jgi:hypothetical protein